MWKVTKGPFWKHCPFWLELYRSSKLDRIKHTWNLIVFIKRVVLTSDRSKLVYLLPVRLYTSCTKCAKPHCFVMEGCSKTLDFSLRPCPVYDKTNCRVPGVITSCKIISTTPRQPCTRYTCQVCLLTYGRVLNWCPLVLNLLVSDYQMCQHVLKPWSEKYS